MGEALTIQVRDGTAELLGLASAANLTGLRVRLTGEGTALGEVTAGTSSRTTIVLDPGAALPPDGHDLRLVDPELVPFAALSDVAVHVEQDGGTTVVGDLVALTARTPSTFPGLDLHGRPDDLAGADVVVTDRPLLTQDIEAVRRLRTRGRPLVLVGLVGDGRPVPREILARALRAAVEPVVDTEGADPPGVRLLVLPDGPGVDPVLVRLMDQMGVARSWRARPWDSDTTSSSDGLPWLDTSAGTPWPDVLADLRRGVIPPTEVAPPDVGRELQRLHPSALSVGTVLLFTGLSGSGKSTVAAGVAAALRTEGSRRVTVLDGDRVRTLLSSGLSFSKEDREVNVRRIGYVAAEVARHGGTAVCAPIAPYASTRAEVRSMVEEAGGRFVLVHVATPLAVCEARDRKGLYARARTGRLPSFTGISDPYEEPEHPDLRLDTSTTSVEDCVAEVVGLLRRRGFVAGEA
ncbi:adenylyl-sulfate kinase [Pseudokineococcus basanitobsidens]|uniref:Adenylyl-sulfate kinase n=1 Tax=Pseudokineococcus basanitobsidens TaxID=1926649 RepID=A0ABU8RMN3_9ACTN